MVSRRAELLIVIIITLVSLLPAPEVQFITLIPRLLLLFFLPGYALMALLFPETFREAVMRITLSAGFSIALVIVGGLALYLVTNRIDAQLWLFSLGSFTLATSGVTVLRRQNTRSTSPGFLLLEVSDIIPLLMIILSVMAAVLLFSLNRDSNLEQQATFTQLWIQPAAQDSTRTVVIGIHNQEQKTMTYRVEASIGREIVATWASVTLSQDEEWTEWVVTPRQRAGTLKVNLYTTDNSDEVYRYVTLRLASLASNGGTELLP